MKKILALSDCHFNRNVVDLLMGKIDEYDYVYFCGDGIDYIEPYAYAYPNKIEAVKGNCDSYFNSRPYEIVDKVEDITIFLTHGHNQGVKHGLDRLEIQAQNLNANLVVFGHTHQQTLVDKNGIIYLNPGCAGRELRPEYAEILISKKNIEIKLRKID